MRNNIDELLCRGKTIKEQRLSDKQAKSRYINYHSISRNGKGNLI